MKVLNKEEVLRGEALAWWKAMSVKTKKDFIKDHKPTWTFEMVDSSTMTITDIYKKEHNK